jgi:hypothetical protein
LRKKTDIAAMSSPIDPTIIESRKRAIEASYQRQLGLAGKPGYDPQLTIQLKQDLDWLNEQNNPPNEFERQ